MRACMYICLYSIRVCSVCARTRESEWKRRRWETEKGKLHFLREPGLAVILGRYDFRGRI